jgi:hypothetical protein
MTDGIPTLRRSIAALIANSLSEQAFGTCNSNGDSLGYVNVQGEDVTNVCIDGYFDLEAIAEAVIIEVRADMIANG